MRPRRESFLPGFDSPAASLSHGGEAAKGKRKTYRPIDRKQALHVVLRSSIARGSLSMLHPRHCNRIEALTREVARRWGVRLYRYANVGNHIHLLAKVPSRPAWQKFIRELAGAIPIVVTGAKKGDSLKKNASQRGFWDHLVFTRIVSFGRDFDGVARYIIKNLFEAAGVPMKKLRAEKLRVLSVEKDGSISGLPP